MEYDDADVVKIMTVHAAKGLEFKQVFLADLVDKKFPTIAMSESTRKDFIDLRHPPEKIFVIPEGIDIEPVKKIKKKEVQPTFIYLGRLKKSKRVDHVLKTIKFIKFAIWRWNFSGFGGCNNDSLQFTGNRFTRDFSSYIYIHYHYWNFNTNDRVLHILQVKD